MNFTYKFDKILTLREREKDQAVFSYQQAMKKFEEVAEKLYQLLKKKEDIEAEQFNKIQKGIPVQDIRLHQQFITNLQKEIDKYQLLVIRARQKMQAEKNFLVEKNIEVKRLERLKEKDFEQFLHELNIEDGKQMDEIAMQAVAREK